jgi:hypothetical protein
MHTILLNYMIRTDMRDLIRLTVWKIIWREQNNGWLQWELTCHLFIAKLYFSLSNFHNNTFAFLSLIFFAKDGGSTNLDQVKHT